MQATHLQIPQRVREKVTFVFSRDYEVPSEEMKLLWEDLFRWLEICRHPSGPAVFPSMHGIDELWHAFILCTREYADFCQGRFGEFVHHDPSVGEKRDGAADFDRLLSTIQLVFERYGAEVARRWFEGESPRWGRARMGAFRKETRRS